MSTTIQQDIGTDTEADVEPDTDTPDACGHGVDPEMADCLGCFLDDEPFDPEAMIDVLVDIEDAIVRLIDIDPSGEDVLNAFYVLTARMWDEAAERREASDSPEAASIDKARL